MSLTCSKPFNGFPVSKAVIMIYKASRGSAIVLTPFLSFHSPLCFLHLSYTGLQNFSQATPSLGFELVLFPLHWSLFPA